MHSLINANNISIVALNVYDFFLNKPCAHIKKNPYKTPFLMSANEIYIKFKYTRYNFFVQRIYLRLKFLDEINGCTYKQSRSVKGLLLTFRSEQEKGDNG